MAGGPIIDVTNFIDERRFSCFQGRVLALCILLQICDGIDLQAIGYTGARIRAELHPTLAEMGWVFSAGLIGMACGALIFGPVADKIGRRAVLIISVFLFGAFSLAIANAGLQGAVHGMQSTLTTLKEKGVLHEDAVTSFTERQRLVDKQAFDLMEARYAARAAGQTG
jgi:hypothetical protein